MAFAHTPSPTPGTPVRGERYTDYPMAMGDFQSVEKVRQLDISEESRKQILGGNAARALNL